MEKGAGRNAELYINKLVYVWFLGSMKWRNIAVPLLVLLFVVECKNSDASSSHMTGMASYSTRLSSLGAEFCSCKESCEFSDNERPWPPFGC